MRRWVVAVAVAVVLVVASPASGSPRRHHRERCDRREDCRNYGGGNGNEGSEGDQGDGSCHSFCDNIIVVPNPVPGGKQQADLVTDPKKLAEFPVTVVQLSLAFAQSILKLVV